MQGHVALGVKYDYALFSPHPESFQNPRLPSKNEYLRNFLVWKCRGVEIPVRRHRSNCLTVPCYGRVEEDWVGSFSGKDIDVATLGNLCVDVVLSVPKLPPKPLDERKAYLEQLSKSPPDKEYWEAGGNCNMAIAAARLGMRVATIGHVGKEAYGRFLLDVLDDQGISMVEMSEQNDADTSSMAYETLLCWVLVDPLQKHGFCSRADFSKEPTFSWLSALSNDAKMAIRQSKVIFCNGYGFDELSPHLLLSALSYAVDVGVSIFFDPGPRGKHLMSGSHEQRMALEEYLRFSDVLLLTSEEAEALTGIEDPILAGKYLLSNGKRTKWVVIKMGPKGSVIITPSTISCAPGFKVKIVDTVGCGDSFVAAIAFGYIHKLPLVHTLAIANAVGASTAMGVGAGRNVAKLNQVMELIAASNLDEDVEFWDELLEQHLNTADVTLLSKLHANGNAPQLHRVSFQKVAADLLPKLEAAQMKDVVAL